MRLVISRRIEARTTAPTGSKGLRQTFSRIMVEDDDGEVIYDNLCLERPKIKGLSSVSRLPEGEYEYKVMNKTPESPFSFIKIQDSGFEINREDTYVDAVKKIMVGNELRSTATHYEIDGQREVLREISKLLPEKGTLYVTNEQLEGNISQ